MNREIKFRVWDGNIMWYPNTKTVDNSTTTLCFFNRPRSIGWGLYEDGFDRRLVSGEYHQIMQYTGLKDKNGKDIYEGDILRLGNTCSFVVWSLDGWRFNSYMERGTLDLYPYVNTTTGKEIAEIIGNIYETPQLLNKDQEVKVSDTTKAQSMDEPMLPNKKS